jgi:hypothetical protein
MIGKSKRQHLVAVCYLLQAEKINFRNNAVAG